LARLLRVAPLVAEGRCAAMAAATEEQEAKRRKLDEAATDDAKEESPGESEGDAPADARKRITEGIGFNLSDCTLNVVPMQGGHVFAPLTGGGLQYLIAGARANVGVAKGRYCFEAKIIAVTNPAEPAQAAKGSTPQPRQAFKIGFATKDSSLFLGETSESVCFDSEGGFTADANREAKGFDIAREQTVAVVLNLDAGSPNKNTISLFKEGERCLPPQPLPERLIGKALFPVINFRNVTVQVHFGPSPLVPLPFSCRGLQDMAKDDSVAAPAEVGKDGKYEVLLPVGLPDEATFEWLDDFLSKNPKYTELSDRAIIKWAESSGLQRSGATSWKHSNDKPEIKFNVSLMDDWSLRKVLNAIVATQPRNYVVMEVKANLMQSGRADLLKKFNFPHFKKVAQVTMGDPPKAFMERQQEQVLKQKQEELDKAWNARKAEKERKKAAEARVKAIQEAQRKAKEAKAAKEKEAKEAKAAKEAQEAGKDDEAKDESKLDVDMEAKAGEDAAKDEEKEEKAAEAPKEEEKAVEEPEEERPVAMLTDEEKALKFRKLPSPDLTPSLLGTHFMKFSLPEASEGFDEVRFSWAGAGQCDEYFKAWVLKQKVLNKIEDLAPGEWFKAKQLEWKRAFTSWNQKQNEWKDPAKRAAKKAAKEAAAKKAAEEAKKAEAEAKKAAGDEGEKPAADGDEAEKKPEAADSEPASAPAAAAEDVDPMTVADMLDIGDGEPLFANFATEDWALLALRFEFFLLAHSFPKDAQDPERVGIHESNIPYYYHKYFRKNFNLKYYGVDAVEKVVDMIQDAISLTEEHRVLATELPEDAPFDKFVRLTEDKRRVRQKAIDAGEISKRLKFNAQPEGPSAAPNSQDSYGAIRGSAKGGLGSTVKAPAPPPPPAAPRWQGGGGKGGPYGGYVGKGGRQGGGRPSTPQRFQWPH